VLQLLLLPKTPLNPNRRTDHCLAIKPALIRQRENWARWRVVFEDTNVTPWDGGVIAYGGGERHLKFHLRTTPDIYNFLLACGVCLCLFYFTLSIFLSDEAVAFIRTLGESDLILLSLFCYFLFEWKVYDSDSPN
jgi:hypothetical protein